MKISEQVWIATALLHREQPSRSAFEGAEILRRVSQLQPRATIQAGVNPHIYLHCVANKKPNPAKHRMLYRNADGTLRLYRQGDECHPERANGKIAPDRQDIPPEYAHLFDWYWSEYSKPESFQPTEDTILGLQGLGKEVWEALGGGDAFIKALRSSWFGSPEPSEHRRPGSGIPRERTSSSD